MPVPPRAGCSVAFHVRRFPVAKSVYHMSSEDNIRELEEGIERRLSDRLSYGGYLMLDRLLSAQKPLSDPPHHDEMLFILQHQVAELWMKLIIHELRAAMNHIRDDNLDPCFKILARVKQVQGQLYEMWGVLETLTPSEYLEFRHVLGSASGFQSVQYRTIEFMLGNKNAEMMEVYDYDPEGYRYLKEVLESPSLYDEFLRYLSRIGLPVPEDLTERDWTKPHRRDSRLIPVFKLIYEDTNRYWDSYEMCENLVDLEENFQLWRFRHMKTVERIIGHKRGTGGSSGVNFLRKALDLSFFPELIDVRTEIEPDQPAKV